MTKKLIHDIANSLIETEIHWDEFLHALVEETNSHGAVLLLTDHQNPEKTRSDHVTGLTEKDQDRYETYFNRIDPVNNLLKNKNGEIIFLQDIPINKKSMEVEEDFMVPCGFGNRFAMNLPCNNQYSFNIYVNRYSKFSGAEKKHNTQLLESLKPNIKLALDKEKHRSLARSLMLTSRCHGNNSGFIILNKKLKTTHIETMVKEIIGVKSKYLMLGKRLTSKHLPAFFIQHISIVKGTKQQVNFSVSLPAGNFDVSIIPTNILIGLSDWQLPQEGIAILFYRTSEKLVIRKRLMGLYGFTRAEAEAALLFARCPSIKEMAIISNRSEETVRTHIKRIMPKVGVHSQSELLRVLLAFTLR